MNTYMVDYGTAVLKLQLQRPARSRPRSAACCSWSRSRCSASGRPASARRGSSPSAPIGTLLIAFPMYFLLQFATFPILVGTHDHRRHPADPVVGRPRRTDVRPVPERRSATAALSVAYSIAALLTAFVPSLTLLLGHATGNAWWHPGIVLAIMCVDHPGRSRACVASAAGRPIIDEVADLRRESVASALGGTRWIAVPAHTQAPHH